MNERLQNTLQASRLFEDKQIEVLPRPSGTVPGEAQCREVTLQDRRMGQETTSLAKREPELCMPGRGLSTQTRSVSTIKEDDSRPQDTTITRRGR